jgi:hypothetical protein
MSIRGCSSHASYCQPSAAAGFVYLEVYWTHVPFVFSSIQPYPPFAISVISLIYSSHGEVPLPPSPVELSSGQLLLQAFPSPRLLGCPATAAFSGGLIYNLHEGLPLPHSPELRAPCPLCYVSFFFQLLVYYSVCFFLFFVFPGWGSVCPGGYANLVQGCLWEYHVPLCSPGGLLLPSRIGAGV